MSKPNSKLQLIWIYAELIAMLIFFVAYLLAGHKIWLILACLVAVESAVRWTVPQLIAYYKGYDGKNRAIKLKRSIVSLLIAFVILTSMALASYFFGHNILFFEGLAGALGTFAILTTILAVVSAILYFRRK
ncbi:hypothetical protein [Eupransor demetentiae]|uniref:Uncharacterized protein n=1 Tax=Eupransor demetentiae TaxID=3109584 RepID=A0ABP0EQ58_9LACO|nr:hypothetical protein R54876_GBNLAHCA_00967 [Lactobacillaceae bacterium LMG 33000]